MKTLLLFTILFLFTFCNNSKLFAQNVVIPDVNFKAYLVGNTAINTNGDTEIQVSEATAFTGTIDCNGLSISNLTGIEAFTGLTLLGCNNNSLSSLDVSQNTALTILYCYDNSLSSLDFTQNTALTDLRCYNNSLSSLDVTQNTALYRLWCYTNLLTSLNVTQNTVLTQLYCDNNSLSSLDVSQHTALYMLKCHANSLTSLNVANGNNTNFTVFDASNNTNLTCIQVDDTTYSNTNWTNIDAGVVFRTNAADCSVLNSISKITGQLPNLNAYPNPTSKNISISLGKTYDNTSIDVRNIMGQVVFSNNYNSIQMLDLELDGATGMYFISVRTEEGEATIKVLKN